MTNQPTPDERRTAFQIDLENLMARWGIVLTGNIVTAPNIDPTVTVFIQSLQYQGKIAPQIGFEPKADWTPPKTFGPTPDTKTAMALTANDGVEPVISTQSENLSK